MSVEELNAPLNDSAATDPGTINTDVSDDDALGAVFDRMGRDGDVSSGENPLAENPLEGGGGGEQPAGDTSTPPSGVPLPSNWRGLEDTWGKIPPELREPIRAHEEKLHRTLSEQGQVLSAYKPLGDVISSYREYFNGERASYKPHEAIDYLFSLQRNMDARPLDTLLEIADNYELRPELARIFAAGGGGDNNPNVLLARIGQLENTIRSMGDPAGIDQRISQKLHEDRTFNAVTEVIGRASKDMPLYAEVEGDLPIYITKSWEKLGPAASQEAVLKRAYDMAVNADPDLRAKAAAFQSAAAGNPNQVAAAKRANQANLRSTSTGRTRDLTEEEELGAVYDKHKGN